MYRRYEVGEHSRAPVTPPLPALCAHQVWELRGADLTLSPVHRGAVGRIPGSDRGVALRFPRFIRVRDDKAVEDASGPDVLVQVGRLRT
jgi:ATP-dependent DNA ligase